MKEISIDKYARYYYLIVFVFIIKQFFDGLFLHQFNNPVLIYPHIDNTYWAFHLLQIPQFIVSNTYITIAFDLILISTSFALIFLFKNRLLTRLFAIWFFIYFICVNSFSGHHSHMLVGILLSNLIFCFNDSNLQVKLIKWMRYYLLFIMSSAAIWKIWRGSVFDINHFSNLLYNQHIYEIYENKNGILMQLIQYLITHKNFAHILYILATGLELIFIIGFFTRKFDKILIALFIVFFVMNYFLMGLNFVELSILLLSFWRMKND